MILKKVVLKNTKTGEYFCPENDDWLKKWHKTHAWKATRIDDTNQTITSDVKNLKRFKNQILKEFRNNPEQLKKISENLQNIVIEVVEMETVIRSKQNIEFVSWSNHHNQLDRFLERFGYSLVELLSALHKSKKANQYKYIVRIYNPEEKYFNPNYNYLNCEFVYSFFQKLALLELSRRKFMIRRNLMLVQNDEDLTVLKLVHSQYLKEVNEIAPIYSAWCHVHFKN
jgi:DNA repair exonuclease SbcCD ATPase subunit